MDREVYVALLHRAMDETPEGQFFLGLFVNLVLHMAVDDAFQRGWDDNEEQRPDSAFDGG